MLSTIVLFEQNKPDECPISNYPVLDSEDIRTKLITMLQKQYNRSDALPISFINGKIKTSHFVGTIKCHNVQIEILPKFLSKDNDSNRNKSAIENLMYMLNYTKQLDIKWNLGAKLSNCSNLFQETLIRIYVESLFNSLRHFTPKNYVLHHSNLHFVKGKIKLADNIRYNICNAARFYCEFDEFSENNELNQLFLYVTQMLHTITQDGYNKKQLKLVMEYYADINNKKFNRYNVQKIQLTRNQHIFKTPFMLAKMFVENSSTDMSAHTMENIALIWDMNKLFEEFVYQFINQHKSYLNVEKVSYQKVKPLLTKTGEKRSKCKATYVDIMIKKKSDNTKIVLDTKYKTPSHLSEVASADIYQIATYCTLHGCAETVRAILLYPSNDNLDNVTYTLNADEDNNNGKYKIKTAWIDLTQPLKLQETTLKNSLVNILQ